MRMKTTIELDPVSVSKITKDGPVDITEEKINQRIRIHSDEVNNSYCSIEVEGVLYNFFISDVYKALVNVENTTVGG